ncbi:uncharacterized protein CELE_R07B1.9 [Caenorhabditis elegans]|uniref:Uncharacterized protein R07B1.9 n=1 Tax=Caenorhabditis elegans TaxID=6239 RepID=YRN9_CAEEL|nr:Uncharacterized protein CELE_R07B1.9 [Caenorhabditis elegans]Q09609.1 RecName: Full=Uncharacterized protein R07B1.9 [Caenorhabditis elegans]CAA88546.1 Uncharacterized protein CELE_R07B1.9 [Caenorhabditis elegans]|eukprot:NP_509657.1 Uncharacterized protein CELE_R07B1.9 [Caenorhabditis elegans]
MSARSAYLCQIQICNGFLIAAGLLAVGLAGSQFSKVGLDNYRDIDFRLLNFIHVVTGCIGFYSLWRNHGSIVTKSLYLVSFVIGFATAVFYGFTTYRVVKAGENLNQLQSADGFNEEFQSENSNYAGRIVISALMIASGAVASLFSLFAIFLLSKIIVVTIPVYPLQSREQELAMSSAKKTLASIGLIKFILAFGILGLCVFIEYEHENVAGQDKYIKIGLDHISAMLCIVSGAMDIWATKGKNQQNLNLKVALAVAVVAATWCLKTVDNNAMPFYKNDLKFYYQGREVGDPSITSTDAPRYILVVAHGVLLGCFGIAFFLSTLSAVIVGTYLHLDFHSMHTEVNKSIKIQTGVLNVLHVFWGACMLALCILGLLDTWWRGEFLGADLLWVSVLFMTTGLMTSNNYSVMITTKFILSVVCLGISVEKMCASANLIYQMAAYPAYRNGNDRTFVAQIILYSIQAGIYLLEALTSLAGSYLYGTELRKQPNLTYRHSNGVHGLFSLGTLFYAVVITGTYIVFELGKWRYNEIPIEVPFFRLGNGPLAGAVFIVQFLCIPFPSLLASASILNIIIASISLFTVSSAITNVYYLQRYLQASDLLPTTETQQTIYQVAIILAAGAALACVICTVCAIICSLRSSYILHHRSTSPDSTVVAPLGEEQFGSGTLRVGTHMRTPSRPFHPQQSPAGGGVQPMEEQSVYWSADENPFYYHTSKRFYGKPYQIESGFYGYALAGSGSGQPGQSPANVGDDPNRMVQSSASQTQIGHVFNN